MLADVVERRVLELGAQLTVADRRPSSTAGGSRSPKRQAYGSRGSFADSSLKVPYAAASWTEIGISAPSVTT